MSKKIGFILVKPQLGENIGSCARALKNFGFSKLDLVEPRDGWPNTKARMTSVGAYDIIKKSKIFKNTLDSIKQYDLVLVIGRTYSRLGTSLILEEEELIVQLKMRMDGDGLEFNLF